jgi:hypothetical protein
MKKEQVGTLEDIPTALPKSRIATHEMSGARRGTRRIIIFGKKRSKRNMKKERVGTLLEVVNHKGTNEEFAASKETYH